MLVTLLQNPLMLVVVIIAAIIIAKLLKMSKKIIFGIICLGLAYWLVTAFGIV